MVVCSTCACFHSTTIEQNVKTQMWTERGMHTNTPSINRVLRFSNTLIAVMRMSTCNRTQSESTELHDFSVLFIKLVREWIVAWFPFRVLWTHATQLLSNAMNLSVYVGSSLGSRHSLVWNLGFLRINKFRVSRSCSKMPSLGPISL